MLSKISQALGAFKNLKMLDEIEKLMKIGCLWIDNGSEFNSNNFSYFCVVNNIKIQLSAANAK